MLPVGTRVINTRDETGTVVARKATTPPEATPVVYDADENLTVWNTVTSRLRIIEEE